MAMGKFYEFWAGHGATQTDLDEAWEISQNSLKAWRRACRVKVVRLEACHPGLFEAMDRFKTAVLFALDKVEELLI